MSINAFNPAVTCLIFEGFQVVDCVNELDNFIVLFFLVISDLGSWLS